MNTHAKLAVALAGLLCTTAGAMAGNCIKAASVPKSGPQFASFAAAPENIAKPAPVMLKGNNAARRFGTALTMAEREGPNFAGHYTIASWGCGTGCLDWGVIDAKTGKAVFDPKLRGVTDFASDWTNYDVVTKGYEALGANTQKFDLLLFRRDSALLVVLGAPGEDEARDGIGYYHWTGTAFEQVRFIPAKTLCRS
jgi:hypothetical protein